MNLIEYLYPLVCNDLNFILFLTILINFLMFLFTASNKYFGNNFWNV